MQLLQKNVVEKKVMTHYVEEFKKRNHAVMNDFIIIGYTSDKSVALNLQNKLVDETGYKGDIYIMQMGVSVGTHVGLGGLSMFFMEKDRKHDGLLVNEMNSLMKKKDEVMTRMAELNDQFNEQVNKQLKK